MRTRNEIERNRWEDEMDALKEISEVLLDIRDLLAKETKG